MSPLSSEETPQIVTQISGTPQYRSPVRDKSDIIWQNLPVHQLRTSLIRQIK